MLTTDNFTARGFARGSGVSGSVRGMILSALFLVLLAPLVAQATAPREAALFAALDQFHAADRYGGFEALYQVGERNPGFLAAHLIEAALRETDDLDLALLELRPRSGPDAARVARREAYARLAYWFERPPSGHLPSVLINVAPERKQIAVADTQRTRLYLFVRDGERWAMRGDWYASIGWGGVDKRAEGDGRTPLGVYFLTMRIAERHLPESYGAGALGLNYPNGWDRRRGRTGHGIWIHGEADTRRSRSPNASDGCLIIANPGVESFTRSIGDTSIPVIIDEELEWLAPDAHEERRQKWLRRVEDLVGATGGADAPGIYAYPVKSSEDATMVLVELNPGNGRARRHWQYWRQNGDGVWHLAHEERPASFREVHYKGLPPHMPRRELRHYTP